MRSDVRVLAFDVFGTVVDWHGTIAREIDAMALGVDGSEFAHAWRAGYRPAMHEVRTGRLPWTKIDALHRRILDDVLARFRVTSLDEPAKQRLNLVWHRLDPWPDAVAGLARLRTRYTICTLSNGNLALLADMAKHAGLPWDLILSAEVFRHYKPDRETYLGVADVFDVAPAQVMMVAAHKDDLAAARACGLATAFVERPREFGDRVRDDLGRDPDNDVHARDFLDLAEQLVPPAS